MIDYHKNKRPDKFSHLDDKGQPSMVDVTDKKASTRIAVARTIMLLDSEIVNSLEANNFNSPKGAVFQTAIIAGTMAVKKTSDLIPLCHPLPITKINIDIAFDEEKKLIIDCTVKLTGKTGVEMEALTGCSVAALTVYDMCKAFSHKIVIQETKLLKKSGVKSDYNAE